MAATLVFGLVVGSFLNVVIARLPEGKSIWGPRSECPGCTAPIAWYDNIPLVSFALLRGRCRRCAMAIPWRYPIVEAATAAAFALALAMLGPTPAFVAGAVLLALLIAITAIDLRHQIIPDAITLPGVPLGALLAIVSGRPGQGVPWLGVTSGTWPAALVDSIVGAALLGGIFLAIILASGGGMGGGDMKLGAMLGAFLGWRLGLVALMMAVLTGGLLAIALLALRRRGRKDAIPFGPFLALGGAVAFLWGDTLLGWYLARFAH